MNCRKILWFLPAIVIVLAGSFSQTFAQVEKKEQVQPPPFHTGGALLPDPTAQAPRGGLLPDNPMILLAKPKNHSAGRISSYDRDGGNQDTVSIPGSGEEITIVDLEGSGAITHIWTTFRGEGRDLLIRIYWEGSPHPSVEAPIGDFFGVAMGVNAEMSGFPIQSTSEGRARNCWWHMPFNRATRVTVTNTSPDKRNIGLYYYIDYALYDQPTKDISYFHARFIETDPPLRGKPILLSEAVGEGHFVGVVMGHRARTPGWFGEGDDIITVDGKISFIGTGTEDYFCDAWGFREFSEPFFGVPIYEGRVIGDRLSAYRFHIMDPIPFKKSFKFEIEHWPWVSPWPNTGRGYFSSLGFWYQKTIHAPWPRLESYIFQAPWDSTKGRWFVQGAKEAEDLGILDYKSYAAESSEPDAKIGPTTDSAEVMRAVVRYGPRPAPLHLMPNFSGDYVLSFDAGGEGGEFTVGIPVDKSGARSVKIHFVRAEDYGVVQLFVNSQAVGGPIDTFKRREDLTRPVWPPKEYVFDAVDLKAGLNAFRFQITDKNKESLGYRMAIDCIVIE
jgi:hypothetical protein